VDVPTDLQPKGNASPFVVEWQLAPPAPISGVGLEEPIVAASHPRSESGESPSRS
jgi:hypothetical protein